MISIKDSSIKRFIERGKLLTPMLIFILIATSTFNVNSQDVYFKATAPSSVVQGEQFHLSFSSNKEGKNIRLPGEIKGLDVLFGPSTHYSFSSHIVNGKQEDKSEYKYVYVILAREIGTYTIEPATISIGGKNFKSKPIQIKVLPPDAPSSSENDAEATSSKQTKQGKGIQDSDAFIRAIVSKNNLYEQESLLVTFRLYTRLNISDVGEMEFPEYEGFHIEDISLPRNRKTEREHYNGKNYYAIDLKKSLIFPQRSGNITIPSGKMELTFSVNMGEKIETFFGTREITSDVTKVLKSKPITINIKPLPANKPDSFSGAVGKMTLESNISNSEVKANEAITLTLKIKGSGNLKLIHNPEIELPNGFESYDPKEEQDINISDRGVEGTKTIEYLFIPRYEGDYTIPSLSFSYFDISSNSYKVLSTPTYNIKVAKGDPQKNSTVSNNYVNQKEVKVEQDIRFLKSDKAIFRSNNLFFVGTWKYWISFIIPAFLFIMFITIYSKKVKENSNIALMKTKRANKIAKQRLKVASSYLANRQEEKFYEEILRALWGYFSDKLLIHQGNLTKENIESELSLSGVEKSTIDKFMEILNSCEFARYAPSKSNEAMDKIYSETVSSIEKMENQIKKR